MRAWLDRNAEIVIAFVACLALAVSFAIVILISIMVVFTSPAGSAANLCERHKMQKVYTRDGRSWRCRRVPQMMREKGTPAPLPRSRPNTVELEPEVRTVRVIQIYGRSTVHERIERAFEKIILFPVEDEP